VNSACFTHFGECCRRPEEGAAVPVRRCRGRRRPPGPVTPGLTCADTSSPRATADVGE